MFLLTNEQIARLDVEIGAETIIVSKWICLLRPAMRVLTTL
jgi:hypothetical protein